MTIYEYLLILSLIIVATHTLSFRNIREQITILHQEYRVTRYYICLAYIGFYFLKVIFK